mmetsp:Transcript_55164/g.118501  ORF Transcript_55164/g.118501 Transcript_55164/m.118501 type:complete len:244 (-) Transcript_55164:1266-1997(-)
MSVGPLLVIVIVQVIIARLGRSVRVLVVPFSELCRVTALECVQYRILLLPQTLQKWVRFFLLAHLADRRQFGNHLLEQQRLGPESVPMILVVHGLAVFFRVICVLPHRQIGYLLEDHCGHIFHLRQQPLQRLEADLAHSGGKHVRGADHEHHDDHEQKDVHEGVGLARPGEVEVAQEPAVLLRDNVSRPRWRPPGRGPRQHNRDVGWQSGLVAYGAQAVGEVIVVRIEGLEATDLPRKVTGGA